MDTIERVGGRCGKDQRDVEKLKRSSKITVQWGGLGRAVLALLLAGVSVNCSPPSPEPSDSLATFTTYLDARIPGLMDRYAVPGLTVALVRGGEPVWSGAYGYADLDRARPMTVDAIGRTESISKSITAWAVMRLVEEGRIDLDAPFQQYLRTWDLPQSPYSEDSVSVRRLLSGSAGMPLGTVGVLYSPEGAVPSLREALTKDARLVREPGAGFSYSNVGFNLLELLIEEVTGRDFAEFMEAEVLGPLGMDASTFTWSGAINPAIPTGYDLDGVAVPAYVYPYKASGGLFANVGDLARFAAAAMTDSDQTVLHPETVRELHAPRVETAGLLRVVSDAYGYGHFIERLPDGRIAVWHGGQGTGWMTHFHAVPESGDGIVILTNSQRSWPLMAKVLNDWALWSGLGSVKMGRISYAVAALRVLIAIVVLTSFGQAYRLMREMRRGERRFAPMSTNSLRRRVLLAVLGIGVFAALAWSAAQPHLMLSSVLPGMLGWAGASLFLLAALAIASALFPRSRAGAWSSS